MSTSAIASSDKIQTALTNLGIPDGFIAYDTVPLLRQLVVALGNVTTGGGSGVTGSGVVTGGGTIATGGFTFTVPATGTAALLGTANSFTAGQTIAPSSAATCLTLTGGTVTTSNPLVSATQTWNAGAVTFTGLFANITNTASAIGSKLLDLQFGGASKFQVLTGAASSSARTYMQVNGNGVNDNITFGFQVALPVIAFNTNAGGNKITLLGDSTGSGGAGEIRLSSDSVLVWSASTTLANSATTVLARDADHVIAQRNSTNAQTSRIYGTYTDSSNYTRLSLAATSTTMTIACETAGTGADNIDLTLTPAGTGVVQFGTHSVLAAETVTGYITIKDAAGNSRKIAVVS